MERMSSSGELRELFETDEAEEDFLAGILTPSSSVPELHDDQYAAPPLSAPRRAAETPRDDDDRGLTSSWDDVLRLASQRCKARALLLLFCSYHGCREREARLSYTISATSLCFARCVSAAYCARVRRELGGVVSRRLQRCVEQCARALGAPPEL